MVVFNFDNNIDTFKHVYNVDKKAIFFQVKFIDMIDYFINVEI